MTGDTKYQIKELPFLSSRTNSLLQYTPEADVQYQYDIQPTLHRVEGPIDPSQFVQSDKEVLPPSSYFEHDACVDLPVYRRNSLRGRRRNHALQLAADYRLKPVFQFRKWFVYRDQAFLEDMLNNIRAFCQGMRVTFTDKSQVWYQVNTNVWSAIKNELFEIRERTLQIAENRKEDIPEMPEFASTNRHSYPHIEQAVFSANDWEILAAAYRCEVEAYILTCIALGYDHAPSYETQSPEDAEEEVYEEDRKGPHQINSSVLTIINESMGIKESQKENKSQMDTNAECFTRLFGPVEPAHEYYKRTSGPPSPIEPDPFAHQQLPQSTLVSKPVMELPTSQLDIPMDQPASVPSVIPPYRETQTRRVFGGGTSAPEQSYRALTGTERFEQMFKPSQYTSQPPQ